MAYRKDKKVTVGQLESAVQAINTKTAILQDFIEQLGLYTDEDGDLAQQIEAQQIEEET